MEHIEQELDRLDHPEKYENKDEETTKQDNDSQPSSNKKNNKDSTKGRQRLRDRKKQTLQKQAKKAAGSNTKVQESKESRRTHLNECLVKAHH